MKLPSPSYHNKCIANFSFVHRMRRYHAMSVSRGRVAAKAYSIAWSLSPILRLMPQRAANEINTIGKLTLQRAHIIKQKCRQICLDITILKIVVA